MTALLAASAGTLPAACPCIIQWTRMVLFHFVTSWRIYLVGWLAPGTASLQKFFPFDCPLALEPLCQSGGCMAKFDSAVTG